MIYRILSFSCGYFLSALEPKHNPTIALNRSGIEQSNPKSLVPFGYRQRLLFEHRYKGGQLLALANPSILLRFECVVMFKSGVIAIFNAFGFQSVGFLRLGDGRILLYAPA